MADKKVKWKPSAQEYCFVKQTDDKPGKLIVGTFGDTNVVTEFDVGGSASAGVNSLNGLQGDVNITSQDSSVGIKVNGQNIDLSVVGGSGQPTNITGDNNILVNQDGYNANLSLSSIITNVETIINSSTSVSSVLGFALIPDTSDTDGHAGFAAQFKNGESCDMGIGATECEIRTKGDADGTHNNGLYIDHTRAQMWVTANNASGVQTTRDVKVTADGVYIETTGEQPEGLVVSNDNVDVHYGQTNITLNSDGMNLKNGDEAILLTTKGFTIEGNQFEITTSVSENNSEIQINNGTLNFLTYDDTGISMNYAQDPLIGMEWEYMNPNSSGGLVDNHLQMDASGLYFYGSDGVSKYLNYFITTPTSSNPIATQADLTSSVAGVSKLNSLDGSINIVSPDGSVDIKVNGQQIQLQVSSISSNVTMHNDGLIIDGSGATLSSTSCCIHTQSGNLNVINATFTFTAESDISDNSVLLAFPTSDFTLPAATFLVCYDITTSAAENEIHFYTNGINEFSLYGCQAHHTYTGTLSFSYIEGGNN